MTDSTLVTNPTGGAEDRRRVMQPALHDVLMEGIVAADNMRRAWRQVRRNRGAPGIDGMRIEDFPAYARGHWPAIRQAVLDGTYRPQPVRRVSIPKPGGGERLLGIPTVVDRLIQQAIAQVMGPVFDAGFSESSFGFRPRRGAHGALRQVQASIKAGYRIAVDLDLAKFFDNVQHDILMARVAKRIGDTRLLALIGRYLRAGVVVGETFEPSEIGTPQGGVITPWTQKITSSLSEKLAWFVRYRSLTCVARSNTIMTNGAIHQYRKGKASERRIRSARSWSRLGAGGGGTDRRVWLVAPPGVPLPARGAEHQASGGSMRTEHSDHHQGSRGRGGHAAGACAGPWADDRRNCGARRRAIARQAAPAWLIAAGEAMRSTSNTPLTACWQRNWRRSMTSSFRIVPAVPANLMG